MSKDGERKRIVAIQRFLRKGVRETRVSGVWRDIHNLYEVGRLIQDKRLVFSSAEIEDLRQRVILETNLDPLHDDLSGGPLDMASKTFQEKLAGRQVFADLIQVARPQCLPIPTHYGDAVTPPGSLLSVHENVLDTSRISKLVLIENGSVAANWHRLVLPEICQDAVLIYRGHGKNAALAKSLRRALPAESVVYTFYDFDPAGLLWALGEDPAGIILPADWAAFIKGAVFVEQSNKASAFLAQAKELALLIKRAPESLRPVVEHIQRHKLAVMQEHLLVHNMGLTLLKL